MTNRTKIDDGSHGTSRAAAPGLLLVALPLVLFAFGCGGGGGDAEAEAAEADSLVEAILGSPGEPAGAPGGGGEGTVPPESMRRQEEPLDITRIGYNQGSPDAPVKVIELSDFGCGYCMRFHTETYPTLREEYVEAGLVEWKFIPFVLGMFPNGMEAAEAAECAGAQEAFQPMKRRLFQDQRAWRDASDPTEFFTRLAREEGLDADRFRECLRRDLRMDRVRENIRLGREMGVRGTPNFVVAGVPLRGALPLATFREILDLVLKERGLTPPEH